MKALTVLQPYGSLVAASAVHPEGKTVENRSYPTGHRGALAIHAGMGWLDGSSPELMVLMKRVLKAVGWSRWSELPRGKVIAIAQVVDCHREHDGCCRPWGMPGAYHWTLADVRLLEHPILARGRQRLWEWTPPRDLKLAPPREVSCG